MNCWQFNNTLIVAWAWLCFNPDSNFAECELIMSWRTPCIFIPELICMWLTCTIFIYPRQNILVTVSRVVKVRSFQEAEKVIILSVLKEYIERSLDRKAIAHFKVKCYWSLVKKTAGNLVPFVLTGSLCQLENSGVEWHRLERILTKGLCKNGCWGSRHEGKKMYAGVSHSHHYWHFGLENLLWFTVLHIVGCWAPAFGLYLLDSSRTLPTSHLWQLKYLQTLPSVFGRATSPLGENSWQR